MVELPLPACVVHAAAAAFSVANLWRPILFILGCFTGSRRATRRSSACTISTCATARSRCSTPTRKTPGASATVDRCGWCCLFRLRALVMLVVVLAATRWVKTKRFWSKIFRDSVRHIRRRESSARKIPPCVCFPRLPQLLCPLPPPPLAGLSSFQARSTAQTRHKPETAPHDKPHPSPRFCVDRRSDFWPPTTPASLRSTLSSPWPPERSRGPPRPPEGTAGWGWEEPRRCRRPR